VVILYWTSLHRNDFRSDVIQLAVEMAQYVGHFHSILGETVGTCILAYFILDEVITVQQGIGIALILIGLAVFLLQQRQVSEQQTNRKDIGA